MRYFNEPLQLSYKYGVGRREGGGSDKGLKPQPRDSDMNILGYFEDIKNTANGLL